MKREMEIEILMADRCTRSEAEKHLDKGAIIYDSPEDYIDTMRQDYPDLLAEEMEVAECETPEEYAGFLRGLDHGDMVTISYDDHDYFVTYCL